MRQFLAYDARDIIQSPALCLPLFDSLCKIKKTENQLVRFVIAYLVADNNAKRETVATVRDPRPDID